MQTADPPPLADLPAARALPPEFIEGWRRRGIESLLPLQRRVLAADPAPSRLVVAPTSAGKTLLAEFALARALAVGRKAAFLVPTRALAEEKLAEFEAWLAPAGLRALCATRDRPETDPQVLRGEFDLLVAVYEKMNHYLLVQPQILASIGAVAIDEIQSLADPERGATLDLLLTKIRLSPYPVHLTALSAAMPEPAAAAVARALGAELTIDSRRPRPLREGVVDLSTGLFRWREGDSAEGEECLAPLETLQRFSARAAEALGERSASPDPAAVALLAVAASLAESGEQTLLFAPTRAATRLWAAALSQIDLGIPPARLALPRLLAQEPGGSNEFMRHCLESGVAFHNADLSEGLRALVESAFRGEEVRIVVATSTLGMGVNLSGRNVLQYPQRFGSESDDARPTRLPLGRSRFANQGGRAARWGRGEGFGRSIAVAAGPAEARRLWNDLVAAPVEPIPPPLARAPLASVALDLLGGASGRTAENIASAIGQTISAALAEHAACSHAETESFSLALEAAPPISCVAQPPSAVHSFPSKQTPKLQSALPGLDPSAIAQALESCRSRGLVSLDPPSALWRLTGLGEAAAAMGLSIETATAFANALGSDWLTLSLSPIPSPSPSSSPVPSPRFRTSHFELRASFSPSAPTLNLLLFLAQTAEGRRASAAVGGFFDSQLRRQKPALLARLRESLSADDPSPDPDTDSVDQVDQVHPIHPNPSLSPTPSTSPIPSLTPGPWSLVPDSGPRSLAPALSLLLRPGGPSRDEIAALRLAFLLADWIAGADTAELERAYQAFFGAVSRAAREFQWLLSSFAACAAALGASEPAVAALRALADRASFGLPVESLPLARLRARGVTRSAILLLVRSGFSSPESIAEIPPSDLSDLIGQDAATALITSSRRHLTSRSLHPAPSPSPAPPVRASHFELRASSSSLLLELNLRSPGLIRARGREILLPPLSYELLAALAERPGEVVTRQALYHRLWPDGGPEDQQLDNHRRAMLKRLRPALGADSSRVAEVVRGIGFRLAAAKEQIHVLS